MSKGTQEKMCDLIYETLKANELPLGNGAFIADIASEALYKAGYMTKEGFAQHISGYHIKQVIVTEPEVELPEGSQAVSVKHRGAFRAPDFDSPECWQVVYLEPDIKEAKSEQQP